MWELLSSCLAALTSEIVFPCVVTFGAHSPWTWSIQERSEDQAKFSHDLANQAEVSGGLSPQFGIGILGHASSEWECSAPSSTNLGPDGWPSLAMVRPSSGDFDSGSAWPHCPSCARSGPRSISAEFGLIVANVGLESVTCRRSRTSRARCLTSSREAHVELKVLSSFQRPQLSAKLGFRCAGLLQEVDGKRLESFRGGGHGVTIGPDSCLRASEWLRRKSMISAAARQRRQDCVGTRAEVSKRGVPKS